MTIKLAVLASGSGTNFEAIAQAVQRGVLDADIRLVLCNRPGAGVLERARSFGVPAIVMDHTEWSSRSAYDHAAAEAVLAS